jgi:protein-disulfide isomerase
MAKKTPPRRKQQQTRETNWLVIGGLIALGVLVFGGLLYLALRPGTTEEVQTLAEYCAANPDRCAFSGDEAAPVTMVEVSDFGCPHCQTFHTETAEALHEQYVEPGTMRWVALPYALSTTTLPAAAAAMCANEQDSYFEFTDAMFAIDPVEERLTPEGYQQAAETVGLDLDQFSSCLDDGRNISIVNQNRDAARNNQVTGTPTFFLNDQTLSGAQPLAAFAQVINSLVSTP